jgi:hypothetical protein
MWARRVKSVEAIKLNLVRKLDVNCYNFGKYEHYAQDYWAEKKVIGKANYVEVVEEKVLLMA